MFCSEKCRKSYQRGQNKSDKNKPDKGYWNNGQWLEDDMCHSCRTPGRKLCICRQCLDKGVTHKSLGLDIQVCANQEDDYE